MAAQMEQVCLWMALAHNRMLTLTCKVAANPQGVIGTRSALHLALIVHSLAEAGGTVKMSC